MTLKQINPNLWVQELELGIFDVRGALVLGQDRAVIWDTLSHPRDMEPYLPLIGEREIMVAYSHGDWDHVWGTAGIDRIPAVIISHQLCRDRFQTDVPETLRKMQLAEPNKWDEVQLIPPTVAFDGEIVIDLGGLTMTLHHLPGHTEDCLVAFIPELGVALMGDTIETPFPVVALDSPLEVWISGLREWNQNEDVVIVIPSHGPIGGRTLIAETVDYLVKLKDGAEIEVPDAMTDFYRETHTTNLLWRDTNI